MWPFGESNLEAILKEKREMDKNNQLQKMFINELTTD